MMIDIDLLLAMVGRACCVNDREAGRIVAHWLNEDQLRFVSGGAYVFPLNVIELPSEL